MPSILLIATLKNQFHSRSGKGKHFTGIRYRRVQKYLAYFQAYSNSYAPVGTLEKIYHQALDEEDMIGLAIGTRPDCIDDHNLELLKELTEKYYVIVEYGIESVYNRTLEKVNRCHSFEETVAAIKRTADNGIHVGGHLIFGLPGEGFGEMLQSAEIISKLPLTSIKFHQLQIFKGTSMADLFISHPEDFISFSMKEYLEFMVEYIEHLNPEIVVERIAGETPPRYAVEQSWGPRYDEVLREFEKLLEQRDSWQGKQYRQDF